jgi:general secretion pathway protein G
MKAIRTVLPRAGSRPTGFTLVELLVVIVIIGLLATAVVTNYDKIFPKGRLARVQTDLKSIEMAIEFFKVQNQGRLPDSLDQLVEPDENGQAYIKNATEVPVDPWDTPYFYNPNPNGTFSLGSYGRDRQQGGEGEDADIELATLNKRDKR